MTTRVICPQCNTLRSLTASGKIRRHACKPTTGDTFALPKVARQLFQANPREIRNNRSGPRKRGNAGEGLTHSSDLTREGLAMKATRVGPLPAHAADKLLSKRLITPNGCWEWQGWRDPSGYGHANFASRRLRVHRVAAALWLALNDNPDDTLVCHHCDNPPCFNPDHLFLGSHQDNMRDASQKGRLSESKRVHPAVRRCAVCDTEYRPNPRHTGRSITCSKACGIAARAAKRRGKGWRVTPDMAEQIISAVTGGEMACVVATRFGVSKCTVSQLINGKRVIVA